MGFGTGCTTCLGHCSSGRRDGRSLFGLRGDMVAEFHCIRPLSLQRFRERRLEWGLRRQRDEGPLGELQEARDEFAEAWVERPRQTVEVGRIVDFFVEPQAGLIDVVDDELDVGEAAVRGPAVGFGRQPDNDTSSLMGLGKDEFLNHRVASQRQNGNIGPSTRSSVCIRTSPSTSPSTSATKSVRPGSSGLP